jgi:hypothetical protein
MTNMKKSRDLLLCPLVDLLVQKKIQDKNHRLPHNSIKKIHDDYSLCYPWLTMAMLKGRVKRAYKNHTKNLPENGTNTDSSNKITETVTTDTDNERNKGGRLLGTTYEAIEHIKRCENEAQSEIMDEFSKLLEQSRKRDRND